MQTRWIALMAMSFSAAHAEEMRGPLVESEIMQIPSASYFLDGEGAGRVGFDWDDVDQRSNVIKRFCDQSGDSYPAMVLSSRITRNETEECIGSGGPDIAEFFDRYRGYVYLNLNANERQVVGQYKGWTDPGPNVTVDELLDFLRQPQRTLPGVLKTATPETCTNGNQLACADGYYCCKGTCVAEDEECD